MGMGFGIAALIVFVLSLGVPFLGNFITLFALLLAAISALCGSKAWPIALAAASAVKLFFLSPSWMVLIASDPVYLWITLGAVATPLLAMPFAPRRKQEIEDNEFRPTPEPRREAPIDSDVRDWDRISDKDNTDALQEYLLRHPHGRFAELARMKLDKAGIQPLERPRPPPAAEQRTAFAPIVEHDPVDETPPPKPSRVVFAAVFGVLALGLAAGAYYFLRPQPQADAAAPNQNQFAVLPYQAGEQMHAREAGSRFRALPFARPDIAVLRETVEHEQLNVTGWVDQPDGHWYQVRLSDGRTGYLKATLTVSAESLARETHSLAQSENCTDAQHEFVSITWNRYRETFPDAAPPVVQNCGVVHARSGMTADFLFDRANNCAAEGGRYDPDASICSIR